MAEELRDFRGRITVETDAALDAKAKTTGRDRSDLAREVLHEWALQQIEMAHLLQRRLETEGISAAPEGGRGTTPKSRSQLI